jgi:hypothetical protein
MAAASFREGHDDEASTRAVVGRPLAVGLGGVTTRRPTQAELDLVSPGRLEQLAAVERRLHALPRAVHPA